MMMTIAQNGIVGKTFVLEAQLVNGLTLLMYTLHLVIIMNLELIQLKNV